jgi:hypothetical protein
MDNLKRATVSVSIDGDDLVPAEITTLLVANPRLGVRKDEVFLGSHGKHIKARTGKWQLGDDWVSPPDLDGQIAGVLALLTDDMSVWREVTSRFHCYLSVGGYFNDWTGGMTLQLITLKSLADRNLPIDFDLYAPASSDLPFARCSG